MSGGFDAHKSRRGRPTVDSEPVNTRLERKTLIALDGYIARQPEPKPSRPEMIRKILEDRLVHEGFIEPAPGVGTTA